MQLNHRFGYFTARFRRHQHFSCSRVCFSVCGVVLLCVCVYVANAYTYSTFNPNEHAVTHKCVHASNVEDTTPKKERTETNTNGDDMKTVEKNRQYTRNEKQMKKKNIRLKAPKQQQQHEDIHCTRSSVQVLDKNAVNLSI